MPIAFWCVLIAIFLPYLGTSIAKFTGGGFGPGRTTTREPSSLPWRATANVPTPSR